ncbi:energy-coupling factor transporter ATPase [Alkalibacter rhizosphaerae]|uniref:Energy-coupling factor transporter ATPase n=1 Tax=Alkalibacter rhizosphaerae TaxID=2815577 RepID=A0A974XF43_9FIRM|nr:energy-coupling factor transporter ATPase [Alkalibacter rhizosphaerae]QSX07460.1 energy-coupling factor transporter ATPase [Alkalibacter rhizosphaerae]
MNTMIEFKNVGYIYEKHEGEDTLAVDDVSFSVQEGEFIGIIGHNGSGKSTLSKMINAILFPTSGDVIVSGINTKDHDRIWEVRQNAGMVFQNPDNQLVATLVEEEVAFGPENLGVDPKEIRRRVDEALDNVEMGDYKNKKPHQLSGGQKQRIAIAGILAMKPKCIVLDEPTAMLDPSGRKEVMDTIKRLNKEENITILHITHYMDEVVDADRILVMDNGKIAMEGTPREILNQVEKLKSLRLDVPQITELAYNLKKENLLASSDVLTVHEMVDALCQ